MKFKVVLQHNENGLNRFDDTEILDTYREAEERIKILQKEAPHTLNYYTLTIEELK